MSSARVERWPRVVVGALGILVALATATGCALLPASTDDPVLDESASDDATSTASGGGSSAPRSGRPEPDAASIRTDGTAVTLDGSTVWVLVTAADDGSAGAGGSDAAVTVTSSGDGTTSGAASEVTVSGAPTTVDGGRPTLHLAGPEGTTPERLLDGSLVFRDADGVAVAGADAPTGRTEGGSAAYYESGADVATVVVPAGALTAPGIGAASGSETASSTATTTVTLTLRLSASAVFSATWGENEGGRSLAVVPTDWLRAGSLAAQEVGWSQLVARDEEIDTSTMRNQYDCHALGAREKASWNLEPWRPDVGVFEVLAARCNPT